MIMKKIIARLCRYILNRIGIDLHISINEAFPICMISGDTLQIQNKQDKESSILRFEYIEHDSSSIRLKFSIFIRDDTVEDGYRLARLGEE